MNGLILYVLISLSIAFPGRYKACGYEAHGPELILTTCADGMEFPANPISQDKNGQKYKEILIFKNF